MILLKHSSELLTLITDLWLSVSLEWVSCWKLRFVHHRLRVATRIYRCCWWTNLLVTVPSVTTIHLMSRFLVTIIRQYRESFVNRQTYNLVPHRVYSESYSLHLLYLTPAPYQWDLEPASSTVHQQRHFNWPPYLHTFVSNDEFVVLVPDMSLVIWISRASPYRIVFIFHSLDFSFAEFH